MKPLQIAIDGPVGSGKSDISSRLAKELDLVYLYTGAMYRAVAWLSRQHNTAYKDEPAIVDLLMHHTIDLVPPPKESSRSFAVTVDSTDVTDLLFTPENDRPASDVSTLPEVRKRMVARQQELAEGKRVVMEGRDIGYRVLPNAQLKIYLTASVEERAQRRLDQWVTKGITNKTFEEALKETVERDTQDMNRPADPLKKLPDAWELDTTGLSQQEVIQKIKDEITKRNLL